ncbi:MAG TPA: aspartyl protease [Candidatus Hydrogenedentes bacterium]|nr:aspartyl protease [Candidatus Hydrogenedentota bacterium]HPG70197.1 aspartyl protease [Candidatus Hydrogenedentota bacterium]
MAISEIEIGLAGLSDPEKSRPVTFLIDSGAVYSVAPGTLLEELGVRKLTEQEFRLWDGTKVLRKKGPVVFRYDGRVSCSDIVFGEEGDCTVVGALTLASLGLVLDPLRRELKPLPSILAWHIRM